MYGMVIYIRTIILYYFSVYVGTYSKINSIHGGYVVDYDFQN